MSTDYAAILSHGLISTGNTIPNPPHQVGRRVFDNYDLQSFSAKYDSATLNTSGSHDVSGIEINQTEGVSAPSEPSSLTTTTLVADYTNIGNFGSVYASFFKQGTLLIIAPPSAPFTVAKLMIALVEFEIDSNVIKRWNWADLGAVDLGDGESAVFHFTGWTTGPCRLMVYLSCWESGDDRSLASIYTTMLVQT